MARIRYIKPDFFKDEDIAELPDRIKLFYIGLWCQADKAGKLEDRPKRLQVEIMPYDQKFDVEKALAVLSKIKKTTGRPFILRYVVENERFIKIIAWDKNQKPHNSEKESIIPTPLNGYLPVKDPLDTVSLPEGTEKEKEKEKEKENIALFWDYFLLKTQKQFSLTDERKSLIKQRLADHSLDTLKKAVNNFVADDWEGRAGHLDLIYCIGKQRGKPDNLEKWLNAGSKNKDGEELMPGTKIAKKYFNKKE